MWTQKLTQRRHLARGQSKVTGEELAKANKRDSGSPPAQVLRKRKHEEAEH